jgi:hypothetical protein
VLQPTNTHAHGESSEHGRVSPLFEPATGQHVTHREYRLYGRTRFLVPAASRAADHGLDVFLERPARAALKCHQWWLRVASAAKPGSFKETDLLQEIKSFLGMQGTHTVLSVGTPGPHEKNTLVFVGDSSPPGPIVKIAVSPASIALLNHERQWLERLAQHAELRPDVPEVVWAGNWQQAYLLVQSCREGRRPRGWPTSALTPFLRRLHVATGGCRAFHGSRMHQILRQRHIALASRLGNDWSAGVEETLALVESRLGGADLTMVAAHRDFAPWNIRLRAGRPWVFDWEYAADEYLPGYDRFHFGLYPLAKNRTWSTGDLHRVLRLCRPVWDEAGGEAALIAYLLDVGLGHLERDASGEPSPVVGNYFALIDALKAQGV